MERERQRKELVGQADRRQVKTWTHRTSLALNVINQEPHGHRVRPAEAPARLPLRLTRAHRDYRMAMLSIFPHQDRARPASHPRPPRSIKDEMGQLEVTI